MQYTFRVNNGGVLDDGADKGDCLEKLIVP